MPEGPNTAHRPAFASALAQRKSTGQCAPLARSMLCWQLVPANPSMKHPQSRQCKNACACNKFSNGPSRGRPPRGFCSRAVGLWLSLPLLAPCRSLRPPPAGGDVLRDAAPDLHHQKLPASRADGHHSVHHGQLPQDERAERVGPCCSHHQDGEPQLRTLPAQLLHVLQEVPVALRRVADQGTSAAHTAMLYGHQQGGEAGGACAEACRALAWAELRSGLRESMQDNAHPCPCVQHAVLAACPSKSFCETPAG